MTRARLILTSLAFALLVMLAGPGGPIGAPGAGSPLAEHVPAPAGRLLLDPDEILLERDLELGDLLLDERELLVRIGELVSEGVLLPAGFRLRARAGGVLEVGRRHGTESTGRSPCPTTRAPGQACGRRPLWR